MTDKDGRRPASLGLTETAASADDVRERGREGERERGREGGRERIEEGRREGERESERQHASAGNLV